MSSDGGQNLKDLQLKLSKLEESLKGLLQNTESELALAALIQKKLFKDRLPQIPGIKCFSRYISSFGLSAEGFEVFASDKGRDVWLIGYWTQTFGLSSLLMQTLLHFQSQVAVLAREKSGGVEEVFNDLSISLTEAKKQGAYRLTVARLDTHSLKLSGCGIGLMPFFTRKQKGKAWQAPELLEAARFEGDSHYFEAANSAAPVTADRAYAFQATLQPGTRLFYFGNSWTEGLKVKELPKSLSFTNLKPDSELVDDLNQFFVSAEANLEQRKAKADLVAVAFEVEAGKLHLA